MSILKRFPLLALTAGLAVLAGCGTTPASNPGTSAKPTPSASTPAPSAGATSPSARAPTSAPSTSAPSQPAAPWTCPAAGSYLTAIRVGQHDDFDRVVFQFSGGLPSYQVAPAGVVYSDPKGDVVPLPGQAHLRVVFRASAWCPDPARQTYTGPSVLRPYYPQLLVVRAAGDFEQVLSFGIGLAAEGPYHAYALSGPNRVVIDFRHAGR